MKNEAQSETAGQELIKQLREYFSLAEEHCDCACCQETRTAVRTMLAKAEEIE